MPHSKFRRLLLFVVLLTLTCFAQDTTIQGVVRDRSGAPVANARVTSGEHSTTTDGSGHFALQDGASGEVLIAAAGFAPLTVSRPAAGAMLTAVLEISRVEQRVTVEDTSGAAGISTFNRTELLATPAVTLDSTLRQVPGFTLFRRTPSWAANPTTQGISLHGVGASGASRGLALLDGVPLNDPFGGWIYWGRVAPQSIESAEVVQASASELYGSDAVGGVVNLQRNATLATHATLESSIGDLFTPTATALAAVQAGRWTTSLVADTFRTNGYVPVPTAFRGPVDTVTSSTHHNGGLLLERAIGEHGRAFVGGNLYGESRQNGTVLQTNSATIRELRTGADWSGAAAGDFSLRFYGGTESLRQTFTSINDMRTAEALTRDQAVPAAQLGTSLLWSRPFGRHLIVAGAEARWIDGESFEWAFLQSRLTQNVRSGGTQLRQGVYGEDRIRLGSRWLASIGLRYDHWTNYDAWNSVRPLVTTVTASYTPFADRNENAISPRVGLTFAPTSRLTLHASAARGFRAPTLNEMYRSFRVGNVLTQANAGLRSEHSTSVDAGASFELTPRNIVRASYFFTDLTNAVGNVTLTITPALITRQRQNLGRLHSQGVDLGWESRIAQHWMVNAAYEFANPIVAGFAADPTLIGNWIPQVARHNASLQLTYASSKYTLGGGVRYQGRQFDDDRNIFPLASYAAVDAFASRQFARGFEVFLAGENLTNHRYEVGRTPVVTVGPPVLARAGVRWTFGER